MKKILITSVGSLVGQNILDVLESRREDLFIIGINSVAENARNFRCDKVYLVPPIMDRTNFEKAFLEIFFNEIPDLVLAGRDADVIFLSEFRQKNPFYAHRLPFGSQDMSLMMYDKYATHKFALHHNLPFADTLLYRTQEDILNLDDFVAKHGFPLVCKPRSGFGSINVFFVTDQSHLDRLVSSGIEFMLQEYLSPDENFQDYILNYNKGIPLFFQIPENHHYVAQTVIGIDGEVLDIIKTRHNLSGGKAELTEIFENEKINDLVDKYVKSVANSGWVGFLNLQYKPDKFGQWKVFEMNPRMVGATSSRFLLGFDELGLLIKSFFPSWDFPVNPNKRKSDGMVFKYLTDFFVSNEDISKLKERGYWLKGI